MDPSTLSSTQQQVLKSSGISQKDSDLYPIEIQACLKFYDKLKNSERGERYNSTKPKWVPLLETNNMSSEYIKIGEEAIIDVSTSIIPYFSNVITVGAGISKVYSADYCGPSYYEIKKKSTSNIPVAYVTNQIASLNQNQINHIFESVGKTRSLQIPNVTKLHAVFRSAKEFHFVYELLQGSCLTDYILSANKFTESQAAHIIRSLIEMFDEIWTKCKYGLEFITTDDVMFTKDGDTQLSGIEAHIDDHIPRTPLIGTPYWIAPERILNAKGPRTSESIKSSFIWALGVLIHELIDSEPPYLDYPPLRAIMMIAAYPPATLKKPEQYSKELVDFLSLLMEKDPSKRPTPKTLLSHKWLAVNFPKDKTAKDFKASWPSLYNKIKSL